MIDASPDQREFVASAPRGFSDLLARELVAFGATDVRERAVGVTFRGSLGVAYRACLESRLASRVFLVVARFDAPDSDAFYERSREIDWAAHVAPGATIACDWSGRHPTIQHSRFGALRLKDAICDALRDERGSRPDVATDRPSVRVHAHANNAEVTVSIDLAGEGLHRRGYRSEAGEAPLRENVAAGLLLRAGWSAIAASAAEFLDPLCGSGTIVVEAALIALDVAPGLRRDYFGFLGWAGHDARAWAAVLEAAQARAAAGVGAYRERLAARPSHAPSPVIRGTDRDGRLLRVARENAIRAGIDEFVTFAQGDLAAAAPLGSAGGLLVTNPPYGVRLEDREGARAVHRELGAVLRERFSGWSAAVITGAPELGLEMGLRAQRTHTVWNGALECRLLRFEVKAEATRDMDPRNRTLRIDAQLRESPGSKMFANRLAKNLKRLRPWAKRESVGCYRIYDADMPEYAFAIDLYTAAEGDTTWLSVQEYAAPSSIDEESVRRRRKEALAALPDVTGVPVERIHVRTRRRTTRGDQYTKRGDDAEFHVVGEGGLRFWVNFTDYLDTGLFLDHRLTRMQLREAASRTRFLNLFGYTGTASVYAAAGRAHTTTTIDLSRTYLDWAHRNLTLNGFGGDAHQLLQADCREWLAEVSRAPRPADRYELIFLDPPTFSNSKRMEGVLDVERDHAAMIEQCMRLLEPTGLLVFSTNAQRFKLDEGVVSRFAVQDVSRDTLPFDFERNPKIHRCWRIRHS